ncbi:MAG TPA: 16S rRNA (guanine(527)-N(7))-methyltransferase RsmG [Woeseiaceae bacterium]|nr:16S rRNA (guanine(527)-N(7))-methyltransferase RsmG [Woeseiaceae bacterium]
MTPDELKGAIEMGVAELGQELPAGAIDRMLELLCELSRWSARMNLTAVRDPKDMVVRHVLDSLAARPYVKGPRVVDIGTGAGFPGLPIAIAEPALELVLLDRNARKIAFVRHVVSKLGLPNAAAVQSAAEDYAPGERFDTVLCRALAAIASVARMAAHLLAEDGVLLALKGQYPKSELRQLADLSDAWDYTVTELTVPGLPSHSRHVVVLQRGTRQCPA